jgi:hypothetical protein
VEANNTGGQGSRRAVVPSDDDDDDSTTRLHAVLTHNTTTEITEVPVGILKQNVLVKYFTVSKILKTMQFSICHDIEI